MTPNFILGMSAKVIATFLCYAVFLSANLHGQQRFISFQDSNILEYADQKTKPALEIKHSTLEEFAFEWHFPGAVCSKTVAEGKNFDILHILGFGMSMEAGKPVLPKYNVMVAVPDGAQPVLAIHEEIASEFQGFMIMPSAGPEPDGPSQNRLPFVMDTVLYQTDSFYPDEHVKIINTLKIRGISVAVVQIRPVLFNPVTGTLRAVSNIKATLAFEGAGMSFGRLAVENTVHFNTYLKNLVMNGNMIPTGTIRENPALGCDYIIITPTQYKQAADTLAKWKRQLGYFVEVVDQNTWTTVQVKNAIHSRYAAWKVKPDFFVVIGDQINSGYNAVWVPGEVHTHLGVTFVSDLYYACMDGTNDYIPDMAHGRISVSGASEAMSVIRKIIDYERKPTADTSFYQTGLHCAYFQDENKNDTADRRFAQTSEEILHYMVDTLSAGYKVHRIYEAASDVTPKFWNNTFYSAGEPVPSYLRKPSFSWTYSLGSIRSAIDTGKFYVLHRDHGDYAKWCHPLFSATDAGYLKNGNKLPVVFSINCKTGGFGVANGNCLAEALLRKTNGGAAGVIAASYISYSGYNDALAMGLFDAIWPGLNPVFTGTGHTGSPPYSTHAAMFTMGDVLNQALFRMTETWGDTWGEEQHQHEIFHWFGDPAMRIFTGFPDSIFVANLPDTLDCTATTVLIDGCSCKDAFVTMSYDGGLLGKTTLADGAGTINIPFGFPQTDIFAYITFSKHNMRPFIKKVYIRSGLPVAEFAADKTIQFPQRTVFLTCLSACGHTTVGWIINGPGAVTYVNGTNATSINPQVQFQTLGQYTVILVVSNSAGSDIITKTNYITIVDRLPIFEDIFLTDLPWILSGEFETGTPGGLGGSSGNSDPLGPFIGSMSLGTDLSGLGAFPGDYEPNLGFDEYQAISPPINCTGYKNVRLTFQRWLNVGPAGSDRAAIDISPDNGVTWTTVYENPPFPVEDNAWNQQETDISAVADNQQHVRIRFSLGPTDLFDCYSGWNIDAIVVDGEGMPLISAYPYYVDFEDGGSFPEGWTETVVSGAGGWVFQNGGHNGYPPNAHGGQYNGCLYTTASNARSMLITPALDLSCLDSPRLSFWHAQSEGAEQDELQLYYKTGAHENWKPLPSALWKYSIDNWVYEVFLLPEPSDYYFLAFEGNARGGNGITVDDVTIDSGASSTLWTGAGGSDWFDAANWNPLVPNVSTDVVVPAETPHIPVVESFSECQSLTVETGGALTISGQDTLRITGALILEAGENNVASLVCHGVLDHNKYLTTVEKRLTPGRWHYISSPVDTSYSFTFLGHYLKEFNEPDSSWQYIVPTDHFLSPAKGFAAWASDSKAYFYGSLNTGDIDAVLTATDQNNDLVIGDGEGWNLAGNPFPSSIDWDHPDWQKVNIGGSVYVFDGVQYLTWNGSVGNLVDGIIPPLQSFFVKATDQMPHLLIPGSARLHGIPPYKAQTTLPANAMKVEVSGNGYSDATFIHFRSNATKGFDPALDAYKINGILEAPSVYTVDLTSIKYSISSLPDTGEPIIIPLYFRPGTEGLYTLYFSGAGDIHLYHTIELEDLKEYTRTDIKTVSSIQVNALPADGQHRFNLHFSQKAAPEPETGYRIISVREGVVLNSIDFSGIVEVFDVAGRELCRFNCPGTGSYTIRCIKKSGVYLIHLRGNRINETVKVVF